MSDVKTIRASMTNVKAEVLVGKNEKGADVTVTVSLRRDDPELMKALAPLDEYLTKTAVDLTGGASNDRLEELISERMTEEKSRANRNANVKVLNLIDHAMRKSPKPGDNQFAHVDYRDWLENMRAEIVRETARTQPRV